MATVASIAPPRAAEPAAPWTPASSVEVATGRGWDVYIVLAALLIPVMEPSIPKLQTTIVDVFNAVAMLLFASVALARRPRFDWPLIGPVLVISVGSLIAVTSANSYSKSAITMIQDFYLYAWFLVLVALLRVRGDAKVARVAWLWGANIAAAIALWMLLTNGHTTFFKIFGAKGWRAIGLFDGPNSLADYLMMSLFVTISLAGQSNRLLVWGSFLFQLIGLIATKSNGSMSSLLLGMAVVAAVRLWTKTSSMLVTAAIGALVAGSLVFGWWMTTEWKVGGERLEAMQKASFMGRLENSAEGREQIWGRLLERYQQTPLGIGPGNSSEQKLSVGHRERRQSHRSKEAHNDYLGYLVERGPLGLLGLAMLVVLPFVALWRGFRRVSDRAWRAGRGGMVVAALAGGLLATTFHSLTMEKLHFRHYWLFLGLVYAFATASTSRLVVQAAERRPHRSSRRRSARTPHPRARLHQSLPSESA